MTIAVDWDVKHQNKQNKPVHNIMQHIIMRIYYLRNGIEANRVDPDQMLNSIKLSPHYLIKNRLDRSPGVCALSVLVLKKLNIIVVPQRQILNVFI